MSGNGLKSLLLGMAFCFLFISGSAQKVELGINLGAANYQGDLAEDFADLRTTGFSGGAFFRYNATRKFSLRTGISSGNISGTDANSSDPVRKKRNLNFYSNVTDIYLLAEVSPFGFQTERRKGAISPYVFGGFAVFKFNPKTVYNNKVYELQPLGTEGQGLLQYPSRKKYSLTQISYPLGAGVRYNIGRNWNIGFELRYNKTFTDYLDDVSNYYANPEYMSVRGETAVILSNRGAELGYPMVTDDKTERGDYKDKDSYIFTGFTLSYMPRKFNCYKF